MSGCTSEPPQLGADAAPAVSIDASGGSGDLTLVVARRDASMTLIGFCSLSGHLPGEAPALAIDDGDLRPGGGFTQESGSGVRLFFLYAPTTAATAEVRQGDALLGRVTFGPAPANPCQGASSGARVAACGALVVVELPVRLPDDVTASSIVGLEGLAEDGTVDGPSLGFYYFGLTDGTGGGLLRVGFQPPSTRRVVIRLLNAFRQAGTVNLTGQGATIEMPDAVR